MTDRQRAALREFRDAFGLSADILFVRVSSAVLDEWAPPEGMRTCVVSIEQHAYPFVEMTLRNEVRDEVAA